MQTEPFMSTIVGRNALGDGAMDWDDIYQSLATHTATGSRTLEPYFHH